MGAHWQVFRMYSHFARQGWLSDVKRVIDFGSCDTSCHGNCIYIDEFVKAFKPDKARPTEEYIEFDSSPTSKLFDYLETKYDCIDIDGRKETIQLDLNFQSVPESLKGKYDFVCDNGTFEHVFNQVNCFQAAHDVCSVGGLMFFHKPFIGHYNHGFFNYMPDLFVQLAAANRYELKGMWYGINHDPGFYEVDIKKQPDTHHSLLFIALKKTLDKEFKFPYNLNGSDLMGRENLQYEK